MRGRSRTEGALPTACKAEDISTENLSPRSQHESARVSEGDGEVLSPIRRRGLTTTEKLCMRRIPSASPQLSSKREDWCRSIRRTRSESSLQSLPSDSSSAHRHLGSDIPESPSACRRAASDTPSRARVRGSLVTPIQEMSTQLDAQELSCARILRNIYPSTLTGMAFLKPISEVIGEGAPTGRPRAQTFQPDGVMRSCSKHSLCSKTGSEALSEARLSTKQAVAHIRSAPATQLPELQLIRRDAYYDVESDSSIFGDHALRLVHGAANTRHTYRSIHKKNVAESSSITGHRGAAFDFSAQMASLFMVRKKILDSYSCIQDAFIAINVEHDNDLDKREWCSVLRARNFCTLPEARAVYDLMDSDHDGSLSPAEFQLGIEIIAQVTTMEAFRKRLICLGFQSMKQAISIMNGSGSDTTMQPLSFNDFAAALKRVWILEEEEHRAIFNAVRDPGDHTCRASLSDLTCALAVVSPCLLLEELRMQMIKGHGSLQEALRLLSPDDEIRLDEFKHNACSSFGVTEQEADMLFRSIDLDGGGEVSQDEIMRALNLAEPCLGLEDCRRKLRQGYRTIQAAFREAYAPPEEQEGLPNVMHFKVDEIAEVLRTLGLGKRNVARLVSLMGVSDHGVTLSEFFSGARLFAPSCALEELKMQVLQTYHSLEAAFVTVRDRRTPLNRVAFKSLVQRLGAQCDGVDQIFDFLDIRGTGVTTVSEIVAALQCLQCGRHKLLSPAQCGSTAQSNVEHIFEHAIRLASKLKAHVKQEASPDDAVDGCEGAPHSTTEQHAAKSLHGRVRKEPRNTSTHTSSSAEATAKVEIPHQLMARRTFAKVTSSLQLLQPVHEKRNMHEYAAYFQFNEKVINEQQPLVDKSYHRTEERHIVMEHEANLNTK